MPTTTRLEKEDDTRPGAIKPVPTPDPLPAEVWAEGAVSVPTAAAMLDRSQRTVFAYMNKGLLRWGRLGRSRRIPRIDVLRLLSGK